jgi:hypothetical protein
LYPEVANLVEEKNIGSIRDLHPLSGQSIVLVDISQLGNLVECEKKYSSWQNVASAILALGIVGIVKAEAKVSDLSIALISPYRAQVKLLRQRLKERQQDNPQFFNQVEVGTIHQFQGSEADIVIFDMVDGEGRTKLGPLLRGDTGIRLVTVAITRARGKCIIIANREWCQSRMKRADNSLLWDLIVGAQSTERFTMTI